MRKVPSSLGSSVTSYRTSTAGVDLSKVAAKSATQEVVLNEIEMQMQTADENNADYARGVGGTDDSIELH